MMQFLSERPTGYAETVQLLHDLDHCFVNGFANLGDSELATLTTFQGAFAGSPLQADMEACVGAMEESQFLDAHFATLSIGRASLYGALHDALHQQATEAVGRTHPTIEWQPKPEGKTNTVLQSVRQWLMEIALLGFARLEAAAIEPFVATLHQLQADPDMAAPAGILTGFVDELLQTVPVQDVNSVPTTRWCDLWMRCMVYTVAPPPEMTAKPVSGTLEIIGIDLRQHAHIVSFVAYGLLHGDDGSRHVRITQSAYRVDAIAGSEIWLLFPNAVTLLTAAWSQKPLTIDGMPCLPTGDLLWNDDATIGTKKIKLMKQAADHLATATPTHTHPHTRHPIQIAIPFTITDCQIEAADDTHWVKLDDVDSDTRLRIATERISHLSELHGIDPSTYVQLVGLLRFDDGAWAIQPLAVQVEKKVIMTGQNGLKLLKKPPKTSTVATLQERASRLLRG